MAKIYKRLQGVTRSFTHIVDNVKDIGNMYVRSRYSTVEHITVLTLQV